MIRAYLCLGLLLALIGTHWYAYSAGVSREHDRNEAAATKAANQFLIAQKVQDDKLAAAYDKIAQEYERGKKDAQAVADTVVADLRTEQLRLRQRWVCPKLPKAQASPGEPDAAKRDREESTGRIVRAAAECDQQVTKLQDIIRADRK